MTRRPSSATSTSSAAIPRNGTTSFVRCRAGRRATAPTRSVSTPRGPLLDSGTQQRRGADSVRDAPCTVELLQRQVGSDDGNDLVRRDIDVVALEIRSEEHTSELQSPVHLVCRLLLEKKNKH